MTKIQTAKQPRRRRPIVGRPVKWSQMTADQRAAACELVRNKDWLRCDDLESTFCYVLEDKFGFTGVKDWKFCWSLGSCQGDGVAFTGDINVEALAFKHPSLLKYVGPIILGKYDCRFVCSVKQDARSHYSHYNTMDVTCEEQHEYDWTSEEANRMAEWSGEIEDAVGEIVKDASRACELAGYDEIESTREDEYVGDLIEANDWEFTFDEDGGCEWA